MEYSTNITDLKLEIGMYIQELQNGEHEDNEIENLQDIQTALHKMFIRLSGGQI